MTIKTKYMHLIDLHIEVNVKTTELNALKTRLEEAKRTFLAEMDAIGTGTYAGSSNVVSVVETEYPMVEDWDKFYDYIKTTDSLDLLRRQISSTAWRQRLEDQVNIPGVRPAIRRQLRIGAR